MDHLSLTVHCLTAHCPSSDNPLPDNPSFPPKEVGCVKTTVEQDLLNWDLPSYDVTVEEDVVYGYGSVGNGDPMALKLDIYRPVTNNNIIKHPLMIHIHGGSFKGGDKSGKSTGAESSSGWAKRGYVVASINYRLSGDNPAPSTKSNDLKNYLTEQSTGNDPINAIVASIEDTLAAIDFMKLKEYVDPTVIVMNGYSAGAITSLWTTFGVDNFGYDQPPIKAVVSHWGSLVYDQEEVNKLIPRVDVPAFLVHATGDSLVSYTGSQYLANRFETLGMQYILHCRESGDHAIGIDSVEHQDGLTILEAEQYWVRNILQEAK